METKTCLNDAILTLDREKLIIQREKGFLSISTSRMGEGISLIKSIINYRLNSSIKPSFSSFKEENSFLTKILKANKVIEPATLILGNFDLENSVNITNDELTVIITSNTDVSSASTIVILKEKLDIETLLKFFKSTVEAKTAVLWDMGVINGFSDLFEIGREESILVACSGRLDGKLSPEVDELSLKVADCVRKATVQLLKNYGYPKNIIDYMVDVGVKIEDLVDAGMELCVEVDRTEELYIKLHKQLLKSLEDLNVVSLILAGIRLEEDYAKHRVRGVDVDDDPAYLYADEVLGMAVANQIAGTKAIFNFKRYDEEKPGVIGTLGPVLDDIFAGLIAGCMSKIFEE